MYLKVSDFGVGIVSRFLGENDLEKRIYLNTIGPFWHANEVWLVCAGGAMFAAFPHWYATLFSGFYIPFVFMLLALIIRGVSFKFRAKIDNHKWKGFGIGVCFRKFTTTYSVGVAIANFMVGIPIDETKKCCRWILTITSSICITWRSYVPSVMYCSRIAIPDYTYNW